MKSNFCNSFVDKYLRTEKSQRFLISFAPFIVLLCLALGMLAYLFGIPGFGYRFSANTPLGILIRFISISVLVLYCLLCVVSLKIRISYNLVIIYSFLLGFNFLMALISPHTYTTMFLSQYFRVGMYYYASTNMATLLISYLSSVADFVWGFCFLLVLPELFRNKKSIMIVFASYVVFMLACCLYSLIKEKDYYILLMTHPEKIGSAIGAHSVFDSKQSYGVLLCPAFCCSLLSSKLALMQSNKKSSSILLCFAFAIASLLLFFFTAASLCRTAIVGNLIMLIIFYISIGVSALKKKRIVLGSLLFFVFVILIIFFILFLTQESLHSSGILNKLYIFIKTKIVDRIESSSDSRLIIAVSFLREIPTINLFFGLSKGLLDLYVRSLSPILRYGLHSGFIIYLGNYGVISLFITYLLTIKIVFTNFKNIKIDPMLVISIFGCFVTAFLFNISEAEILVFSSSTLVFMFNFILLVFSNSKYVRDYYLIGGRYENEM